MLITIENMKSLKKTIIITEFYTDKKMSQLSLEEKQAVYLGKFIRERRSNILVKLAL